MAKRREPSREGQSARKGTVQAMLSLNRGISALCKGSGDAFAARLPEVLGAFAQLAAAKRSYDFKFLSSDAFSRLIKDAAIDNRQRNKLYFSHLLRTVEAYEIVTVWRAEELTRGCINCLNAGLVIPAAVNARSLIELAARYLLAANHMEHYVKDVPWEKFDDGPIIPRVGSETQNEYLENYIERLLWGSRLKERLKMFPEIEERNILSQLDKFDKALNKQGAGWSIRENYYEFLCEIAHPNYIGNARYAINSSTAGEWQIYKMSAGAQQGNYDLIAVKTSGALSVSLECVMNGFGIFQQAVAYVAPRVGRLLP